MQLNLDHTSTYEKKKLDMTHTPLEQCSLLSTWKGFLHSNPKSLTRLSEVGSSCVINSVPFMVAPWHQLQHQYVQIQWPFRCVAAFSGKLNIFHAVAEPLKVLYRSCSTGDLDYRNLKLSGMQTDVRVVKWELQAEVTDGWRDAHQKP